MPSADEKVSGQPSCDRDWQVVWGVRWFGGMLRAK